MSARCRSPAGPTGSANSRAAAAARRADRRRRGGAHRRRRGAQRAARPAGRRHRHRHDCLPEETMRRAEAAGFKTVPTGIEHGTITVIAGGKAYRGDDAARRHRDRRAAGEGVVRPRLEGGRRAARLHHQRALRRGRRHGGRPGRRARRHRKPHAALHRRCRSAHPRGLSAHPALLPLLRLVWYRAGPMPRG